MKHLKYILMILVIASVAGFVVWQLMWMKEIGNKFKAEQLSGGLDYKIEAKKKNNKGRREKTESTGPGGEERPMAVKEGQTQKDQSEKTGQEREQPLDSKAAIAARPSGEETIPQSVKGSGKWYERDINLGKKSQEVRSVPDNTAIEISNDKTMSVTIKNRPGQTIQKYIPPQPPPAISPPATSGVKVSDVTPHPTSTRP